MTPVRSGDASPARLLDVGSDPLDLRQLSPGYQITHLRGFESSSTIDEGAAEVVVLRFVLARDAADTRAATVASAWEMLPPGGVLIVVDDFNPVPSSNIDWSADHLVRLILDVSGGAAILAEVVVLRRSGDDEERYACVAVTRL